MANSSNLLTYALLGGAAYLAWNWWQSQPAAAGGTTGGGTTGGGTTPPPCNPPNTMVGTVCTPPPAYQYIPPTKTQQLQTAAGPGVSVLNADQWSYFWNQLGFPAVDGTKWQNAFFPSGRPATTAAEPMMTAATYVNALAGIGVSGYRNGLGQWRIPVPVVMRPNGMGGYDIGDFRRAGGRS